MFRNSDVKGHELCAGNYIGSSNASPLQRLSSVNQDCLVYKDGSFSKHTVSAHTTENREIILDFGDITPIPVAELSYSLREEALKRVSMLWEAVSSADETSLPLVGGIVPLYSVFFFGEDGVLLLTEALCDCIRFCLEDSENYLQSFSMCWVNVNSHMKLPLQMIQLLYYAQTGMLPFVDIRVRNTNNRNFLPLSLCNVDPQIAAVIDSCLRIKGDRAKFELQGILKKLNWNVKEAVTQTTGAKDFLNKLEVKYKRMMFIRKKGWLVLLFVGIAAVIIGFITNFLIGKYGPPESAGMTQEQIISYYYQAQNDLDIQRLTDTLAPKTDSPVYMEVTALYVNRATRLAYEQINAVVAPDKWIASGKPALDYGAMLYGVTDLEISRVDDITLDAKTKLYSIYDYYDTEDEITEDTEQRKYAEVYIYEVTERFTFIAKRKWLEISGIEQTGLKLLEVIQVPYKEKVNKAILVQETPTAGL